MGEGRGAFHRRMGSARGLSREEDESCWWVGLEICGFAYARLILVHKIQSLGNLGQSSFVSILGSNILTLV
jgi:hypothetical protein